MDRKCMFYHLLHPAGNWVLFSLMALLLCRNEPLMAQHRGFFRSNGRNINIDSFDREMTKMITDVGVPAISVAVIEDNKVVYAHNYGSNGKPGQNRWTGTRFSKPLRYRNLTSYMSCSDS